MSGANIIALTGVVATAATAMTAMVVQFFTSRADRLHTRRLAAEERLFEARREVYVDLLYAIARNGVWVDRTHPLITFGETEPAPQPPDLEEGLRLHARSAAFASEAVLAALEASLKAMREFAFAAAHLDRAIAGRTEETADDLKNLHELRESVRDKQKRLEDLVRADLTRLDPPDHK